MQIFVLSCDAIVCARLTCDKHVVKQILESIQILYYALYHHGVLFADGYKINLSHTKHPCVLWAAGALSHLLWVVDLAYGLSDEYTHRYGKEHACLAHLRRVDAFLRDPANLPSTLPARVDVNAWIDWVAAATSASADLLSGLRRRVAVQAPPDGTNFGVVAIAEPKVICRDDLQRIDAVRSYHTYYVYKRFIVGMDMKWYRSDSPPLLLKSIFADESLVDSIDPSRDTDASGVAGVPSKVAGKTSRRAGRTAAVQPPYPPASQIAV